MGVRSATAGSFSSEEAGKDSRAALLAGLIISSATFVASVAAFLTFDPNAAGYQLVEQYAWYGEITYKVGVDGLSMPY